MERVAAHGSNYASPSLRRPSWMARQLGWELPLADSRSISTRDGRMLCDRCGSIDVVRARARVMDKVIRLFTGRCEASKGTSRGFRTAGATPRQP